MLNYDVLILIFVIQSRSIREQQDRQYSESLRLDQEKEREMLFQQQEQEERVRGEYIREISEQQDKMRVAMVCCSLTFHCNDLTILVASEDKERSCLMCTSRTSRWLCREN